MGQPIIMLHSMSPETRRAIGRIMVNGAGIALAHPLYVGSDEAEQEARISKLLADYPPTHESKAAIEADIRHQLSEYLWGLQLLLDQPEFEVGFVFESADTLHRVGQLQSMDKDWPSLDRYSHARVA